MTSGLPPALKEVVATLASGGVLIDGGTSGPAALLTGSSVPSLMGANLEPPPHDVDVVVPAALGTIRRLAESLASLGDTVTPEVLAYSLLTTGVYKSRTSGGVNLDVFVWPADLRALGVDSVPLDTGAAPPVQVPSVPPEVARRLTLISLGVRDKDAQRSAAIDAITSQLDQLDPLRRQRIASACAHVDGAPAPWTSAAFLSESWIDTMPPAAWPALLDLGITAHRHMTANGISSSDPVLERLRAVLGRALERARILGEGGGNDRVTEAYRDAARDLLAHGGQAVWSLMRPLTDLGWDEVNNCVVGTPPWLEAAEQAAEQAALVPAVGQAPHGRGTAWARLPALSQAATPLGTAAHRVLTDIVDGTLGLV